MAGIARKSWAQRFPLFALSFHQAVLRSRTFSAGLDRQNVRDGAKTPPVRFPRRKSSRGLGRGPSFSYGLRPSPREGGIVPAILLPFLPALRVPTSDWNMSQGATRPMEKKRKKLEDLVRLALKRLNVSYLTISSRLVWFERETFVCVRERGRRGGATFAIICSPASRVSKCIVVPFGNFSAGYWIFFFFSRENVRCDTAVTIRPSNARRVARLRN